jgi:putative flippase GtrA
VQEARIAILSARPRELLFFVLVGGVSALIYVMLGGFLTAILGWRPSLAIATTLALVMPPTYLAQRNLTFQSRRVHAAAFPRYVAIQGLANGLAIAGAELFPAAIRSEPWLAFMAIGAAVAATNYLFLKLWAFHETHGQRSI